MDSRNQTPPCDPAEPATLDRAPVAMRDPRITALRIDGVHCRIRAAGIRNAFSGTPHVLDATVCPDGGSVEVLFDGRELTVDQIVSIVEAVADGTPGRREVTRWETA